MAKLKSRIIARINATPDVITLNDVQEEIDNFLQEQGLKAHNDELVPGYKGAWRTEQKMTIYKSETHSAFWGSESLRIKFSKYGVGDKAMYYSIEELELNAQNREQERDARIWADLNDGIVGREYK